MKERIEDATEGGTKRFIVWTLCGVTALLGFTVAVTVLRGFPVPDVLDRLVTLAFGTLAGFLAKTGADALDEGKLEVSTPPNEPLEVEAKGESNNV